MRWWSCNKFHLFIYKKPTGVFLLTPVLLIWIYKEVTNIKNSIRLLGFLILLLAIFIILGPIAFVPVGYRGIATRLGTPTGHIRGEGVHFKFPIIEGNKNVEVRVQKKEVDATAASKDLQTVSSRVALNFAVDSEKVVDIYRQVGDDYDDRIVSPAIQEAVKSVTARYTAEELITKRAMVSDAILTEIKDRIGNYGLLATDFNIVDFDFSSSFNAAIEAKVTAEQSALAAKNKLEQVKYEAQQQIEAAKGKAEALQIEGDAITSNPQVVQLRAIEKWNGILPNYMAGDSVPFIQIK